MHAVPSLNDIHVIAFCAEVVAGGCAVEVPCLPRLDRPQRECFPIVEETISLHGGTMLTGWAIWEWPKLFIEAEFHAVWSNSEGELLDITPRSLFSTHIVFLPDSSVNYDGRQIDNVRKPLVKDHDLTRFLFIFRRQFELLNKGDLAFQHGPISLPQKSLKELRGLQKEGARLERRLHNRYIQHPKE